MSGATAPSSQTFNPTPAALQPMQAMMAQGLMHQMQSGGQNVPDVPVLSSIFNQLYGAGSAPYPTGAPGGSDGSPLVPPDGTVGGSLPLPPPRGNMPQTPNPPPNEPPLTVPPSTVIPTDKPHVPPPSRSTPPFMVPPSGGGGSPTLGIPSNPMGKLPGGGGINPNTPPIPSLRDLMLTVGGKMSPISSGSRSIRSGVGANFPSLMSILQRR